MAYQSVVEMAGSPSLLARIIAAAAGEGITDPRSWAQERVWQIVSEPGWAEAWDYAKGTANDDVNPDTGRRPSVINDTMILSAVQAIRAADSSPS